MLAPEIVEAQRAIVYPAFFSLREQFPGVFHHAVAPERAFVQNAFVVVQIVGGDAETVQRAGQGDVFLLFAQQREKAAAGVEQARLLAQFQQRYPAVAPLQNDMQPYGFGNARIRAFLIAGCRGRQGKLILAAHLGQKQLGSGMAYEIFKAALGAGSHMEAYACAGGKGGGLSHRIAQGVAKLRGRAPGVLLRGYVETDGQKDIVRQSACQAGGKETFAQEAGGPLQHKITDSAPQSTIDESEIVNVYHVGRAQCAGRHLPQTFRDASGQRRFFKNAVMLDARHGSLRFVRQRRQAVVAG